MSDSRTSPALEDALQGLEAQSEELNQAADAANLAIKNLEERLAKIGPGLEVRLLESPLSYTRIRGQWRIAVRNLDITSMSYGSYEALANASRETRLRLVPHLPELVERLAEAVEQQTRSLRGASRG